MTENSKTERGQILVLMAFAMLGLIALTALAIDGGNGFADRRHAQNAADAAAYAAALEYSRNGADWESLAQARATSNGYNNDGANNTVTITTVNAPTSICGVGVPGKEFTVEIVSHVKTWFGSILGIETMTNRVNSTARGCKTTVVALFNGNAVVGLQGAGGNCGYDSGSSNAAKWTVTGGGISSNYCVNAKNADSVDLDPGKCVTVPPGGSVSGFPSSEICTGGQFYTDEMVKKMYPPEPPCDGTAEGGIIATSSTPMPFKDGIYCVDDFDSFDSMDIVLENATLYIRDTDFWLKFTGGGGFSGSASTSGDYKGYYMIVKWNNNKCLDFTEKQGVQNVMWRGNGLGDLTGTVFAPTACIDYRGNPEGTQVKSQLVGNLVSSNGTAAVNINYQEDLNAKQPVPPAIELVK